MVSSEEMAKAVDLGKYYKIPMDGRNLNYSKYEHSGESVNDEDNAYTSHNTTRLNLELIKNKLFELKLIKDFVQ